MMQDIQTWLAQFGLQQYSLVLLEHEFDTLDSIVSITQEDLTELGIRKLGARKKFMAAVRVLRNSMERDDTIFEKRTLSFSIFGNRHSTDNAAASVAPPHQVVEAASARPSTAPQFTAAEMEIQPPPNTPVASSSSTSTMGTVLTSGATTTTTPTPQQTELYKLKKSHATERISLEQAEELNRLTWKHEERKAWIYLSNHAKQEFQSSSSSTTTTAISSNSNRNVRDLQHSTYHSATTANKVIVNAKATATANRLVGAAQPTPTIEDALFSELNAHPPSCTTPHNTPETREPTENSTHTGKISTRTSELNTPHTRRKSSTRSRGSTPNSGDTENSGTERVKEGVTNYDKSTKSVYSNQTHTILNMDKEQRTEMELERSKIEQQLKDLAKIVEFQEREQVRVKDRENRIERHRLRAIEHERDILLERERRLQQAHERTKGELDKMKVVESEMLQEFNKMRLVDRQHRQEMADMKLLEERKERELRDLKHRVDELQSTVETAKIHVQAAEVKATTIALYGPQLAQQQFSTNNRIVNSNSKIQPQHQQQLQPQASSVLHSNGGDGTGHRATPSTTIELNTVQHSPTALDPINQGNHINNNYHGTGTNSTSTPAHSVADTKLTDGGEGGGGMSSGTVSPHKHASLDVSSGRSHTNSISNLAAQSQTSPLQGPPVGIRELHSRSASMANSFTSSSRQKWDTYNDVLLAMDDDDEMDEKDASLALFQLTPRTSKDLQHDDVMKNRNRVLDIIDGENTALENCIEVAEGLVRGQKQMEDSLLKDHAWMIKKRITNAYEVAARIGIESDALKRHGVTEQENGFTLVGPNKIVRTSELNEADQAVGQLVLKGNAKAVQTRMLSNPIDAQQAAKTTPFTPEPGRGKRRFKSLARKAIMMGKFVKQTSNEVSAAQRFRQAHERLMKAQGIMINVGATPKPLKRRTTAAQDARRFVDKAEYAQLFKEQDELNQSRIKHDVMYEQMLNSYLENQKKLFAKIAKDPWELSPNDFYSDATELQLKKQLGEIIGIETSAPTASNLEYGIDEQLMFMPKDQAMMESTKMQLEMVAKQLASAEPAADSASDSSGPPALLPM